MKILDRYLLREFLWPFFFSLLVFLFLYWTIDLFSHLDDFLKHKVSLATLAQYYLASIPIVLVQTSPLACVTGAITALTRLDKTHETLALRSCGLSWMRISSPLLGVGIVIAAVIAVLNDRLVPQAMMVTHSIREENLEKKTNQPEMMIDNVALYGSKNRIFYAKRYDPNDKALYDLIIFIDDLQRRPRAKIIAEKAEWIVNDKWKLLSCVSYRLGLDGEILDKPVYYDERTMDLDETPQSFMKLESQISYMKYRELENYIERIAVPGQKVTRQLFVELYNRISFPVSNFVLILAGISFAILPPGPRKRSLTGIGFCVTAGLVFYLAHSLFISLGKAGVLPPWLAAWGVNLVFATAGLLSFQKS